MARHFTVTLTSGTNVGPYDIYYDQINTSNFAKLYGTTNNADGLTLAQVQGGVLVTVPDEASTVLLYNTNTTFGTDCPSTTVTYNIPGQSTPSPTSTPTSTPTPTPSSTAGTTPPPTNTPTPSPSSTPTPTPTPSSTVIVATCSEYDVTYPSSATNPTGTWTYTCCDGTSGSLTLGRDQSGIICAQDGTTITTPPGGLTPLDSGNSCLGCGDGPGPTATPTPSPTTEVSPPTLNTYYITQFRLTADPSTEFCETNYTATGVIQSEATTIGGLLNTFIYDENGDPLVVGAGRYAYVSTVYGASSNNSANDPRYVIEVSNLGQCNDVILINCNGGGGSL